jgi:hypothetical protein
MPFLVQGGCQSWSGSALIIFYDEGQKIGVFIFYNNTTQLIFFFRYKSFDIA